MQNDNLMNERCIDALYDIGEQYLIPSKDYIKSMITKISSKETAKAILDFYKQPEEYHKNVIGILLTDEEENEGWFVTKDYIARVATPKH